MGADGVVGEEMVEVCTLETDGYQARFHLSRRAGSANLEPRGRERLDLVVEFLLDPHLGRLSIKSQRSATRISDLHRLADYLEQHIRALQQNSDTESVTFLTYEMDFHLQALSGMLDAAGEGELEIRFLVNIGPRSMDETNRVYVGGEAGVHTRDVHDFVRALRSAIDALSR